MSFELYSAKRQDYLNWDEYFMALTLLTSKRNKESNSSDAAIILNENKVVISVANANADGGHVVQSSLNRANGSGRVMYITSFPCKVCALDVVQAGIKEVVYYYKSDDCKEAQDVFNKDDVLHRQFSSKKDKVILDFDQTL